MINSALSPTDRVGIAWPAGASQKKRDALPRTGSPSGQTQKSAEARANHLTGQSLADNKLETLCPDPHTRLHVGQNDAPRAGDGIRTHDNNVGNVVLYQLSYTRMLSSMLYDGPAVVNQTRDYIAKESTCKIKSNRFKCNSDRPPMPYGAPYNGWLWRRGR